MRKQDRIANQQQNQSQQGNQTQSPSQPQAQPRDREQMRGSASDAQRPPRQSGKLPLPD